jgi:hypothetical protein
MSNETTSLQKAEPKTPINIDMAKGVLPKDYSEVMQMAALIHNSGLAPKSLDNVQKVAVAMMMAMEVGLPVVTGIQHVAVINGKAGIWGDATLALVRASGMMAEGYPKEKEVGIPYTDGWTFYCTVKRRGGAEVTGSFSWADAKRAGLANSSPPSPWAKYPRRMMQWKARQWVYRDEFGDVLRGMKMAEELYDYIDMEPKGNGKTWEPEPTAPDFDYEAFRKGLIEDKGYSAADIDAFEAKLANHYEKLVDDIHQQIGADPDGFIKSLAAWCEKNGTPPHPPVAKDESPPESPSDDPPPAASQEDVPWESDPAPEPPTDSVRDEFINLRSAGFSTWVHTNKDRIRGFGQDIQKEIREKWAKLYGDITFPLDKQEAPKTNGNGGPMIWCPASEARKYVKVCETCDKAERCQAYQEWVFENATPEN